jgi:Mg-chelatase subunit ChlD
MGSKLSPSRELVSEFLKQAGSQDEFAFLQAADRPVVLTGFARPTNVLEAGIGFMQSKGRSALLDGIYLGIQLTKTGRNARKVLLVISDGDDNSSRYTVADVKSAILESGIQVFVVGVNGVDSPASLVQLAESARGRYVGIGRGSNLREVALELSSAARVRP